MTRSWFHVKQLCANPTDNLVGNVRVEIRIYIRCLKKQINELFYYERRTGSGRKKKVKIFLSIINNKKAKEGNSCFVNLRGSEFFSWNQRRMYAGVICLSVVGG